MRRVTVSVLLDDQRDGVAARLCLECVPDGVGTIYPDPVAMAFVSYDHHFAEAIQDAWQVIQPPTGSDVRWWLDSLRGLHGRKLSYPPLLAGPSHGAAFAVTLAHVVNPASPDLDDRWAIVGSIDPAGCIGSVEGYGRKLEVAKSNGLRVIVPNDDYGKLVPDWARQLDALEPARDYRQASNLARSWLAPAHVAERRRDLVLQQRLLLNSAELIYNGGKHDTEQGSLLLQSIRSRVLEQDRMTPNDKALLVFADLLYGWSFTEVHAIPPAKGRTILKRVRELSADSVELDLLSDYAMWAEASQWRKHGDMESGDAKRYCYAQARGLLVDITNRSKMDPFIRALCFAELAKLGIGERDGDSCDVSSQKALELIDDGSDYLSEESGASLPHLVNQARHVAHETRLRAAAIFGIPVPDHDRADLLHTGPRVGQVAAMMSEAQLKLRDANSSQWDDGLRDLWSARVVSHEPNGFPRFVRQSVRVLRILTEERTQVGSWLREEAKLESFCPHPSCGQWTDWSWDSTLRDFVCSHCHGRLL